jgi:hypothetical protein
MTITEPATMITDYMLTVACTIFAVMLFRLHSSHPAMVFWILAFVFGALAALLGGTHHGFKMNLGASTGKALWDFTMVAIGMSTAFLVAGTIASGLRGQMEYVTWLKWGIAVSAAGFVIQKSGWDIHHHFNHNDLFHIIQIAGFWCFYEGARRLPGI